jgi:hypothetical protein
MKIKSLLIILLIILCFNVNAQEARFIELTGTVEIKITQNGEWQPASAGGLIGKESVISTGIRSSAVISVGASTLTVSALTMLTLEELVQEDGTEEAVLFLRTGRIRADVTPPTGQRAEFTVRSPTTTASVRGTSFSFNGRRLYVHSGRVSLVNNSGQKVYVNTNQRSYADAGRHQRLVLPFEAESAGIRPTFSDLENTGSQRDNPHRQLPIISISLDWI